MTLIVLGAISASADTVTISGTELSTLTGSSYPTTDAQYVAGTPDVFELTTTDAGLNGDAPGVKVKAGNVGLPSLGALDTFSASYDLSSSSGGAGNQPYFLTYLNAPGGVGYVGVISFGGPDFNSSSDIHVIYVSGASGPSDYWGDTLSQLDSVSYDGTTFGQLPVYETIVEIGDWNIDDSIGATANIDSITVSTPDAASTMSLLGVSFLALAGLRRRLNRA